MAVGGREGVLGMFLGWYFEDPLVGPHLGLLCEVRLRVRVGLLEIR